MDEGTARGPSRRVEPKNLRKPRQRREQEIPVLDDVDRVLIACLQSDARMPNNALAAQAGIAPSTCLGRVRALREQGVIRGFHADVDMALIGRSVQAMIAVRMQAHARGQIQKFAGRSAGLPEVLNVFFLAGADDFLIHVAARSTDELRDFVLERLSADPDVAYTETKLIFAHVRSPKSGQAMVHR